MRLGVAVEADAAGSKALQVHDGRHHAFAGEAVERPEQHAIELALVGIPEQRGELLAILDAFAAAFVVNVFVGDLVASAGAPLRATGAVGSRDPDLCRRLRRERR